MSQNQESSGTTRREFLRNAAATAAVTAAATTVAKSSVYALAPAKVIGANDTIVIGHIGMGQQGMAHLTLLHDAEKANNTRQVAVCDLYTRRAKAAGAKLGLTDAAIFADYKKVLDNKDIDCVWVTTSDQWHAQIAIDALEAGKHVYVEKPMTKTLEEAFALYDAVKKTGRVLQVGSQGCSDEKWHVAGRAVQAGKIGHLVQAQGSYCRNSLKGEWEYDILEASPTGTGEAYVDWNTFRKGRGPEGWDPDRYFRWRKYWAYGTGIMGDLFPHRLHPLYIAMGLSQKPGPEGFPIRVTSQGGLYVQTKNPDFPDKPDREVPDFTNITVDFAEGCTLMLLGSTISEYGWEDCIRGNKATLQFGGNGVNIKPERVWADEVDESTEPVNGPAEAIDVHEKNFLDCVRDQTKTPNCNIEIATRVQTMVTLGELSYRNGATMHFDPATRKATVGAPAQLTEA